MQFTRFEFTVVAWLSEQAVLLYTYYYLNDPLLVAPTPSHREWAVLVTVQALAKAGFTINLMKSEPHPTQDLVYIWDRLCTDLGRICLPQDRVEALIQAIKSFRRVELLSLHQRLVENGATDSYYRHISRFRTPWDTPSASLCPSSVVLSLPGQLADGNHSDFAGTSVDNLLLHFALSLHAVMVTTDASTEE